MKNKNKKSKNKIDITNNININNEWELLDEDEGGGSYCCGKRMVLASSEIVYECLNCGAWEYSSS